METRAGDPGAFANFDLDRVDSPAFVVDAARLRANLAILADVRDRAGIKVLAALKAFSMWRVAPIVGEYLDGVCTSGLWETLLAAGNDFGLRPLGYIAYNALRIEAGQPLYGLELSEDVNPLEAGLKSAISFAKGCYTGQEVIARLDTYQKLKQTLVRLELSRLPAGALPLPLESGGAEIGKLTSAARLPDGQVQGLGYVRMKSFQPGAVATVLAAGQTIEATQWPLQQAEPVR